MRFRIFAVLIVLGGTIAVTARARQASESPPPPADRAKLRAEVVRLTTEVELLQLDHEAEWSSLLEALRSVHQSEMMAEVGNPRVERMGALATLGTIGVGANDAAPKAQSAVAAGREYAKNVEARRVAITRAYIERKKKDFARHAADLAGKRLDLSDAQKRYDAVSP